jgi:oxygen-independent coproporphyrinogen III oxidase
MFVDTPLSLYIHIPFCSVRCTYCAFNTYTDLGALIPAYVEALCNEIEYLAKYNPYPSIQSVFVGGGTPSLITSEQYRLIFQTIRRNFKLDSDAEISLESNPNDLSVPYLTELYQLGFNRLSIGMQSATDKILTLFNREHDTQMVCDALSYARQAGFDNVNLDVILGSPYETLDDMKQTIKLLMELKPEHISMYGLELKGGTDLRLKVDSGELPKPDDDLFADMYEYASGIFSENDYQQYEISNWCRPNHECRHNLQYWRNLPYAGVGAGAHGFAGGFRYSTVTSPQRYITTLLDNENHDEMKFPMTPTVAKSTLVGRDDDLYETIMMGLRMTEEGIDRTTFRQRFDIDFVELFPEGVEKFRTIGLLDVDDERVHLTESGRLLSNAVIREFV